jgi:hypothetical protein
MVWSEKRLHLQLQGPLQCHLLLRACAFTDLQPSSSCSIVSNRPDLSDVASNNLPGRKLPDGQGSRGNFLIYATR